MRLVLAATIAGLMATTAPVFAMSSNQAEKLFLAAPTSKTALVKLKAAARSSSATAEDWLGLAYQSGYSHGTPVNYRLALRWFEKSAAQGYANAEFNLGGMYRSGQGVPQSNAEAEHWYALAAAHGSVEAKETLSVMKQLAL